ncbi:MAG: hypothetical protein ACTSWN_12290 [Promethearchaeota archaeon]
MKQKYSNLRDKKRKWLLVGLVIGIIATCGFGMLILNVKTNSNTGVNTNVESAEASQKSSILFLTALRNTQVEKALTLDDSFNVIINEDFISVNLTQDNFDAIVISNYPLNTDGVNKLVNYYNGGGKIFLLFGPKSTAGSELIAACGVDNHVTELQDKNGMEFNYTEGNTNNIILKNIQWSSAPSFKNYTGITLVSNDNNNLEIQNLLLDNYKENGTFKQHEILFYIRNKSSNGAMIVFAPWSIIEGKTTQLEVWPYFNYFIYLTTKYILHGDNWSYLTFSDWDFSPVPHELEKIIFILLIITFAIIAVALFAIQSLKSKKSQVVLSEKAMKEMAKKVDVNVEREDLTDRWEQIGTHKQISGFLFGLFAGIILGIPQIALTGFIFPRWIMPYPQVAGWFSWVKQFFAAIWMVFDVGTSIALAKFFAQYRIKQPKKAVHYIQIFVWWQLLSGVVQVIMITSLGLYIFPNTNFAHMSWMIILHSLIQYPGFFVVYIYIFQGMQRTDLQNLGNLLYQAVLMLTLQYVFIFLFRETLGKGYLGEAFWSGIGYVVGQYVAQWALFFLMSGIFKKLGFNISTIFRVDFTKQEFKEAIIFGGKECIGHMWVPLAYMYQVWIISQFLPNYNEQMGLYGLAEMLTQVTALAGFLTESFLAPVSEAYSHKKQKLLDFTLAQGIKWSNFIIFFMIALLAATGEKFIALLAGENWIGATRFIKPFLIYCIMQPWAWLGDKTLAGAGFTGRAALIWILEQGLKMVLLTVYIMFNILDIMIILMAHIPALVIKVSITWIVIRRKVGKPKLYLWNSWIAPGTASILIFFILWILAEVLTKINSWLILAVFVLGIFVFFYLYSFLCGLFGCYDKNTIQEYKKAADMLKKPISYLGKPLYLAAAFGCQISKLHDKYPLDIYEDAMIEAKELEKEKLKLKI